MKYALRPELDALMGSIRVAVDSGDFKYLLGLSGLLLDLSSDVATVAGEIIDPSEEEAS